MSDYNPPKDWELLQRNRTSGKSRSTVIADGLTEWAAKRLAQFATQGNGIYHYDARQTPQTQPSEKSERDRLRDAVVEAAVWMHNGRLGAVTELMERTAALSAHEAKRGEGCE